jgi:hypothetical protein
MENNYNLLQNGVNLKKTYFIHLKKNEVNNLKDFTMIKQLIETKANVEIDTNFDISKIKFANKSDLLNQSCKKVGRYLKSNKNLQCCCCDEQIQSNTKFKELLCLHRFHIKCIDSILKKDLYKMCPICKTEHITTSIL